MDTSCSASEDFNQFLKNVKDRAKRSQPPKKKLLKRHPSLVSLTSNSSDSSQQSNNKESTEDGGAPMYEIRLQPENTQDKKEKKRKRLTSSKCAEHVAEDIAKVFSLSTDVKFALGFYSLFNTAEQKSVKKALKMNIEKLMGTKKETEKETES